MDRYGVSGNEEMRYRGLVCQVASLCTDRGCNESGAEDHGLYYYTDGGQFICSVHMEVHENVLLVAGLSEWTV
jgi:hypothetical protein